MIAYERHTLSNGLTLLLHEDHDTPLVTVNTLYCVGARNESPERTGFAHLFEHLMFGGTPQVPDFDAVVNGMGGECNASTNNDYTNYYITAPATRLREMLTIEADRMGGLDFSERALSVQQRVVTEEYHQRYLNQPYGDKWLLLRPMCYKVHPYRWCTIGADIRHVQEATVEDERAFFEQHYFPANAIVAVAGDIRCGEVTDMVEELYGCIASRHERAYAPLPTEPEPTEEHRLMVERDVPTDMLCMAFLMCDRLHDDFIYYDLVSDVLSNGESSRLYNELVRKRGFFSELNAYITGDRDRGLFVVEGRLGEHINFEQGEEAVWQQIHRLQTEPLSDYELAKVVNKYESTFAFSQYKASDKAAALCYYEWLGRTDWVNHEPEEYAKARPADLQRVARECFRKERANILQYKSTGR